MNTWKRFLIAMTIHLVNMILTVIICANNSVYGFLTPDQTPTRIQELPMSIDTFL